MLRIVLIARDQLWLDAVSALITQQPDLVVGATLTAHGPDLGVISIMNHTCDLVVTHHDLGAVTGLDLVRELADRQLDLPVVVVGVPEREAIRTSYFELGVLGYVRREDSLDHLLAVIRAAGQGQSLISPQVAAALIDRLSELSRVLESAAPVAATPAALTPREQQVLQHVATGKTNQEISEMLFIEVGTVKNHVHSILRKLDVDDRQQAALVMARSNWDKTPGGVSD